MNDLIQNIQAGMNQAQAEFQQKMNGYQNQLQAARQQQMTMFTNPYGMQNNPFPAPMQPQQQQMAAPVQTVTPPAANEPLQSPVPPHVQTLTVLGEIKALMSQMLERLPAATIPATDAPEASAPETKPIVKPSKTDNK